MNEPAGKHYLSLGLALAGIALLTLFAATAIDRPTLPSHNEPGPTAFPITLAALLLAGGLHELFSWWKERRSTAPGTAPAPDLPSSSVPNNRRLLLFIAALFVYLPALHWLGFFSSTAILASTLAWRLGSRPWVAILSSLALLLAVKLLFEMLFKVSLPRGPFGF